MMFIRFEICLLAVQKVEHNPLLNTKNNVSSADEYKIIVDFLKFEKIENWDFFWEFEKLQNFQKVFRI